MTHSRQSLQIQEWSIFWRWKVLSEIPKVERNDIKKRQFKCKCECWTIKNINLVTLNNWESKSCGCLKKTLVTMRFRKHWMNTTKIYKVFFWIKDRCENPNNKAYKNYWWRWIKNEWNSFEQFHRDMKSTYKEWLTIDRNDNNWNYCKSNCSWETRRTQANNTRNVHIITHNWETHSIAEWARILDKNVSTLRVRIHRWKSIFN